MRTCPVQPGDDVGDCFADAWYFAQPFLRDHRFERQGKRPKVFGSPGVGARAIGISASQFGALAEFLEETGYGGSVKTGHGRLMRWLNIPSTRQRPDWSQTAIQTRAASWQAPLFRDCTHHGSSGPAAHSRQ